MCMNHSFIYSIIQRKTIVAGEYEPTDEECTWKDDEDDNDEEEKEEEDKEDKKVRMYVHQLCNVNWG